MEKETWEKLRRVFAESEIPEWGACAFAPFSGRLLPCRAVKRIPKGAQTVLVALFPYRVPLQTAPNLSRYAVVPDYHKVAGGMLQAACEKLRGVFEGFAFEPFIDNSPLPEVRAAALCGLGVVGQNGLLIHPRYGSWVFIGEVITDLPLCIKPHLVKPCLQCGRCARACPSGALCGQGIDSSCCLSAISQKKGALTAQEEALLCAAGSVWGCDRCQLACPMNQEALFTPIAAFHVGAQPTVTEENAFCLRDRAYLWRGSEVLLRNLRLAREADAPKE